MIKNKIFICFALLLLAYASMNLAKPCLAAQDIFINIEGIPGEAEAQNPEVSQDSINILSYSQSVAAVIDPYSRLVGKINFSDLKFQKYIDKASPLLFQYLATGSSTNAVIDVIETNYREVYWKIELEGVIITSLSSGGSSAEDRLTENVSLAFTKISYTYTNPETKEEDSGGHDTTTCTPKTEICDGVDNDCNGLIDDNLRPIPVTCGTGECSSSATLNCVDGSLTGECRTNEPSAEICDGLDNDCDNTIDEPTEADLSCNDNNPCTDDICSAQGSCQNINNTAPCDDNNACTENDSCLSGACISGSALKCNDNNSCTNDSCNPQYGCQYTTINSKCGKGLPWLMLLLSD